MEIAIGGAAAAAAGKAGGGSTAASGEYWSEALKSFLDHIPVSSVSGAVQSSSPSPGTSTEHAVFAFAGLHYTGGLTAVLLCSVGAQP
jgi:hypothetical protein